VRIASPRSRDLGICRYDELKIWKAAAEAGIAPKILYHDDGGRVLITEFVEGHHWLAGEIQRPGNLARLAELLRATHSLRVDASLFDPVSLGCDFERCCAREALPAMIETNWSARAGTIVRHRMDRRELRLCHNDPVRSNFIDDGERLWLIDWECAAVCDPYYDLATIAHNNFLTCEQEAELVQAYEGHSQPSDLERLARMKVARDFYHVFWYAIRLSGVSKPEELWRGCELHGERFARELQSFNEDGSYFRGASR
jgi:aminoglycoside phosphotransferase